MQTYNSQTFNLRERIIGTSRCSIILKDDNGGKVYCTNKLFNKLLKDPTIQFFIDKSSMHTDPLTGRFFPEMNWIVALIPTKW